ncbi:MAG TPA: hypothetical protein VF487_20055 [Chitinophagaceae bacterium]
MKRIFFAVLVTGATFAANAQDTPARLNNNASNTAYNVPEYIRVNYETNYRGMDASVWEPVNGIWRVTYKNNNRINQLYYNKDGETYSVVLPVLRNNVPETVITAAIDLYGSKIYDIAKMKDANNVDVYKVRILEKAVLASTWMDDKGVIITSSIYRTKTDNNKPITE